MTTWDKTRNPKKLFQIWYISLSFSFAFGPFESLPQNFSLFWNSSKFQNFRLGDGKSWKSQYCRYLPDHLRQNEKLKKRFQIWYVSLSFGFAFGPFESLPQIFGLFWNGSKFQNFRLGDGKSWKSQYRRYLTDHLRQNKRLKKEVSNLIYFIKFRFRYWSSWKIATKFWSFLK